MKTQKEIEELLALNQERAAYFDAYNKGYQDALVEVLKEKEKQQ